MDFLKAMDRERNSDIKHYGVKGMRWGFRTAKNDGNAIHYNFSNPFKANKNVRRITANMRTPEQVDEDYKNGKFDNPEGQTDEKALGTKFKAYQSARAFAQYAAAVNKAAKEKSMLKALKGKAFANDPKRKDMIKAQKERIKAMKKAAKAGEKSFYKDGNVGMRYHVTKAKFEKVKETHFPGPVKDAYDNKRLKKIVAKGQIDPGESKFGEWYDRHLYSPVISRPGGIKKFK